MFYLTVVGLDICLYTLWRAQLSVIEANIGTRIQSNILTDPFLGEEARHCDVILGSSENKVCYKSRIHIHMYEIETADYFFVSCIPYLPSCDPSYLLIETDYRVGYIHYVFAFPDE